MLFLSVRTIYYFSVLILSAQLQLQTYTYIPMLMFTSISVSSSSVHIILKCVRAVLLTHTLTVYKQ